MAVESPEAELIESNHSSSARRTQAKDDSLMPSDELLSLLVCPMGKAPLRREADTLICTRCGPRFTIKDEIPNMLIEEATLPDGCASLSDLPCVRCGDVKLGGP
jgi:uncharacterized protein YbaR (Trm112 family)